MSKKPATAKTTKGDLKVKAVIDLLQKVSDEAKESAERAARRVEEQKQARDDFEAKLNAPIPRATASVAIGRMHEAARLLESFHHLAYVTTTSDPSDEDNQHVAYLGEQISMLAAHRIDQALHAMGDEWFFYAGKWIGVAMDREALKETLAAETEE